MARGKVRAANKKQKNRQATVQQKAAGPQSQRKPQTRVNGALPRDVQHHLVESMGKKSGMHTTHGRMACEMYLEPTKANMPVMSASTEVKYVSGASLTEKAGAAPTAGVLYQGRRTIELILGTGSFGYLIFAPDVSGMTDCNDLILTDATYAGTTINTTGAPGVNGYSLVNKGPSITNKFATAAKLLGAKFTLKANETAPTGRNGSCMIYNGHNILAGNNASQIKALASTEVYPNSVFSESESIVVRPPLSLSPIVNAISPSFDALGVPAHFRSTAIILTGNAGDKFDIELEWAAFTWGAAIPRTITPVLSTAAIECIVSCIMQIGTERIGGTEGTAGREHRQVLANAEHHTLLATPKPIASAAWPVIKSLAMSAGPALLKALF